MKSRTVQIRVYPETRRRLKVIAAELDTTVQEAAAGLVSRGRLQANDKRDGKSNGQ